MFYIIVFFFLVLFTFLLFTPLSIEIDSRNNFYLIRFFGIASAQIIFGNPFLTLEIHAFGFRKIIDPLQVKSKPKKINGKKVKAIPFHKVLQKGNAIIRSFSVKYLFINFDTDDYTLNGLLFPFFSMISRPDRQLLINFYGERSVKLKIASNIERMLLAAFK